MRFAILFLAVVVLCLATVSAGRRNRKDRDRDRREEIAESTTEQAHQLPSEIALTCAEGETAHHDSCYKYGDKKRGLNGAASVCEKYGYYLAGITSSEELSFLRQIAIDQPKRRGIWVGAFSNVLDTSYKWLSGGDLIPEVWGNIAPHVSSVQEQSCAGLFKGNEYYLTPKKCKGRGRFICERSKPRRAIACEGNDLELECAEGAIQVIAVNYGRTDGTTCPHQDTSDHHCISTDSIDKVRFNCDGRASCSVPASDEEFGNPCGGVHKYLDVVFRCGSGRNAPKAPKAVPMDGCLCSIWGDPHYLVSNTRLDFQGDCTYLIGRDAVNDPPTVQVFASNTFRDSKSSATQQEKIYITLRSDDPENPYNFIFYRDRIELNMEVINIPYYGSDGKAEIWNTKKGIILTNNEGFWITWDYKYKTELRFPPEYVDHVDGMCNCAKDTTNPLVLKNGTALPKSDENVLIWGNDWKADECDDVPAMEPISEEQTILWGSDEWCGIMKKADGPFKPLLDDESEEIKAAVNDRFDACVFDMVYTGNEELFCADLEDLKEFAEEHGISGIRFRSETFCPMQCGMYSVYKTDVSSCVNTCESPNVESICPNGRTDRCACIDGYIRSGQHCVREEECGCIDTFENRYYENGQTWVSQDCSELNTCFNKEIENIDTGCSEHSICEARLGDRGCFRCQDGYVGDGKTCTPADGTTGELPPTDEETPIETPYEVEAMPPGPTVPCDEATKTFACTRAAGCCRSSCAGDEQPIMNNMLCGTDLTCCTQQKARGVPCAYDHFGGYCTTHDPHNADNTFCPLSMNTNYDTNYCENFVSEDVPVACCKPVVRDGKIYDPVPHVGDDGLMELPPPPPGPLAPGDEEGDGIGPPGEGVLTEDDILEAGDTVAGVEVPDLGLGNSMPGAGESGDPEIETFDGRIYQFQGKSCTYTLVRECSDPDNNNPLFRITTTHVKSKHFNKPTISVGHIEIHYDGKTIKLDEGDKVEVNGNERNDLSTHTWTDLGNDGNLRMKYDFKNEYRKRVIVELLKNGKSLMEVRYNGEGHDIITINDGSQAVCGILGNNNHDKHDDIQYRKNGQWITVHDGNDQEMDDFANYWLLGGCTE